MANTTSTTTVSRDGDSNQLETPRNPPPLSSCCQGQSCATDDDETTDGACALLAHWGLA